MPTVTWHTGDSPRELWPAVIATTPPGRVIVHVVAATHDQLTRDTARSVIDYLRRQKPSCAIDVIDAGNDPSGWTSCRVIDVAAEPRVLVDAVRLRAGASVPAFWLDPVFLITVCGCAPDPRYGVSAVLAAQARLLEGWADRDLDRIYETHRLLAADLNIACGSTRFGDPASAAWWAVSESDLALEAALARAAGTRPERLPHLRHIARHEIVSFASSVVGQPVALRGFAPRPWQIRLRRAVVDAGHVSRTVGADCAAAAANLRRLPQFVRRRLGNAEA